MYYIAEALRTCLLRHTSLFASDLISYCTACEVISHYPVATVVLR